MALRKAQIQITTTADVSGANQAAAAMGKLDQSTANASTATKQIGSEAATAGRRMADLAGDVSTGGSSFDTFIQKAINLASVLGPKGVIISSLIAIGVTATKTFLGMSDDAQRAEENAKTLADTIKEIGRIASDIIKQDIDFGAERFAAAQEQAERLRESTQKVENADSKYAQTALANAGKIRDAIVQILELQGVQVDRQKLAEDQAADAATKRLQYAQSLIAAEKQRLEDAKAAEAQSEAAAQRMEQVYADTKADLAENRQKLQVLKDQRKELEEVAKTAGMSLPKSFDDFINRYKEFFTTGTVGAAGRAAQAQLESPQAFAELGRLESEIKTQQDLLAEKTGKIAESLREAYDNFQLATTELEATEQAVATTIQGITETFEAGEIKARADELQKAAEAQAEGILGVIETITPMNAQQQQSIANLQVLASDGKIAANESLNATTNLSQLYGSLTGAQTEMNSRLRELINNQNLLATQLNAANVEIRQIKGKINQSTQLRRP
jgi:DNA repair exonuclease SbcCD ATPase subunit